MATGQTSVVVVGNVYHLPVSQLGSANVSRFHRLRVVHQSEVCRSRVYHTTSFGSYWMGASLVRPHAHGVVQQRPIKLMVVQASAAA
jgi:hypothetical protein